MEVDNKNYFEYEVAAPLSIKYSRRHYINSASKRVLGTTGRKSKRRIADNVLYFIETNLKGKEIKLSIPYHKNSITLDEREIVRLIDVLNHQIHEWK